MKIFQSRKITAALFSVISLLSFSIAEAKPVNLYDNHTPDAKIIGSIESTSPIVPIFATKEGDWIKVGDPKNGNTGWAKASELTSATKNINISAFSFSQQTINTPTGPKTYNTIQFGLPDPAQTQEMIKNLRLHSNDVQKSIQKMMKDLFVDMNTIYPSAVPLFMPIIMVPPQELLSKPVAPQPPKPAPKNPSIAP